eukprot:SAG22_NODE_46_length_24705_cov_89.861010_16_plen_59_part_00
MHFSRTGSCFNNRQALFAKVLSFVSSPRLPPPRPGRPGSCGAKKKASREQLSENELEE